MPGIFATVAALGLSLVTLGWLLVTGEPHNQTWYTLVDAEATFDLTFGILIDQLSAAMLVIV